MGPGLGTQVDQWVAHQLTEGAWGEEEESIMGRGGTAQGKRGYAGPVLDDYEEEIEFTDEVEYVTDIGEEQPDTDELVGEVLRTRADEVQRRMKTEDSTEWQAAGTAAEDLMATRESPACGGKWHVMPPMPRIWNIQTEREE